MTISCLKAPARSWPEPHRLWSIDVDPITMLQAVARIREWIESRDSHCQVVVTPNTDHVVQLYRRPSLQPVYRCADLTLADGWPLVAMSRILGNPLPERVAGSDLLPALCQDFASCSDRLRIFLLGGKPGVPERAANSIETAWPAVKVVGTCSPEFGFECRKSICRDICEEVNRAEPDILVVGLGFPKQELWLSSYRELLRVPVALAVGATIDFLAGEQIRAPRWVQAIRMEWLHRLATNPRRLAKRYALDAIYFPLVCWKHCSDRVAAAKRLDEHSIVPRRSPTT